MMPKSAPFVPRLRAPEGGSDEGPDGPTRGGSSPGVVWDRGVVFGRSPGGPAGDDGAVRPAASRPGERRHRHQRWPRGVSAQRDGPGFPGLPRGDPAFAPGPSGYRAHPLLHDGGCPSAERATLPQRDSPRSPGHCPQRQPGERASAPPASSGTGCGPLLRQRQRTDPSDPGLSPRGLGICGGGGARGGSMGSPVSGACCA